MLRPADAPVRYVPQNARDAFVHSMITRRTPYIDVEEASVKTHGFAALLFTGFSIARPFLLDVDSLAGQLCTLSSAWAALIFGTSTAFHVYRHVPGWGNWMRHLDITSIYVGLSLNGVADMAIVTNDFRSARWQTIADPLCAAGVVVIFFFLRRTLLPWNETREVWSPELPHARVQHADLEHEPLRAVAAGILSLNWTPVIPCAFALFHYSTAALWVLGSAAATAVLWLGNLIDSVDSIAKRAWCVVPGCGLCESHAIWHVVSLAASILHVGVREVVLFRRENS